jgi:hypothetical protein
MNMVTEVTYVNAVVVNQPQPQQQQNEPRTPRNQPTDKTCPATPCKNRYWNV